MDPMAVGLLFAIVLACFGIAVALMIVGQRLSGRCMRGSCGGQGVVGPGGERLSCADCPNRDRDDHRDHRDHRGERGQRDA